LFYRAGDTGLTKGHTMSTDTDTDTATLIQERVDSWIAALNHSSSAYHHFVAQRGRKYVKVVDHLGGSVHAFYDPTTGAVFKAAGWSRPAPHARYQLTDDGSWMRLLSAAKQETAFSGAYLYLR
jgi:hypothetical protein